MMRSREPARGRIDRSSGRFGGRKHERADAAEVEDVERIS
jgi:hypothetical protein